MLFIWHWNLTLLGNLSNGDINGLNFFIMYVTFILTQENWWPCRILFTWDWLSCQTWAGKCKRMSMMQTKKKKMGQKTEKYFQVQKNDHCSSSKTISSILIFRYKLFFNKCKTNFRPCQIKWFQEISFINKF